MEAQDEQCHFGSQLISWIVIVLMADSLHIGNHHPLIDKPIIGNNTGTLVHNCYASKSMDGHARWLD